MIELPALLMYFYSCGEDWTIMDHNIVYKIKWKKYIA